MSPVFPFFPNSRRSDWLDSTRYLIFIGTSLQLEALMNQMSDAGHAAPRKNFTAKQGQYLAFIYAYTRIHRRPPAEADMQRHFQVTPPSVHQMVLTLERAGLIRRTPRTPRSIELNVAPEDLPILR